MLTSWFWFVTGSDSSYTVSQKNVSPLACYDFDTHEWILIFFSRNVTGKVGNQRMLYYATSNNLCYCTTWQNWETQKARFSLSWTVSHAQCTCALSSWKKTLSSVMCLIASNICWGSKTPFTRYSQLTTGLTIGCIQDTAGCQSVVKRVSQPVWQQGLKISHDTVHWLLLQAWRKTTPIFHTSTDTVTDLVNTKHVGNRQ